MKTAFGLGAQEAHGRSVLQHSRLDMQVAQTSPSSWLFSGRHTLAGHGTVDEEIYIQGNRLIWSCSGVVRKQFTMTQPILQAGWVSFAETGQARILCFLQPTLLTTCTLEGELQTVPNAEKFTRLWPLCRGLLLTGPSQVYPWMLTHPLEALQPMQIVGGVAQQPHNNIIWTDIRVPYVIASGPNQSNQKLVKLAVWQITEGAGVLPANHVGSQASYSRLAQTPPGSSKPPGTPGSGPGSMKRGSIRLPNGNLSPAAFSPVPRSSAAAALQVPTGSALLLPLKEPQLQFSLLWEQDLPSGMLPDSACLATDDENALLLCMHGSQSNRLTALRLLQKDTSAHVEVAFTLNALSVAAVTATRRPSATWNGPIPPTDLLVLHSAARLALYVGSRHVCDISLKPAAADNAMLPFKYFQRRHLGDEKAEGMVVTPVKLTPIPRSTSDVSMGSAADLLESPPNRGMPDVKALAEALEPPPDVASLQDAVGDRVTVVLQSGGAVRVALPFSPAGPLPKLALEALQQVLPPGLYHSLASKHLLTAGGGSGKAEEEWVPLADTILGWALDPSSMRGSGLQKPLLFKTFSMEGEPPTPGGPPTDRSDAAWDNLVNSNFHRQFKGQRHCSWATECKPGEQESQLPQQATGQATAAEQEHLWQALYALHSLYEDFKLHLMRVRLLPHLGKLLFQLARVLGASDYQEHYRRDLGPCLLEGYGTGGDLTPQPTPSTLAQPPASIHEALHSLLQGSSEPAPVPHLATKQAPCVQRSCGLLELYSLLRESNATATQLLSQPGLSTTRRGSSHSRSHRGSYTQAQTAFADAEEQRSSRHPKQAAATAALQQGVEKLVMAMVEKGWTLPQLDSLPLGVALPLKEGLQRCRPNPPSGWPLAAYVLIGRDDIAATVAAAALPVPEAGPLALPLVSPLSALALATPLHHGDGASPNRPSLGRTPIRQPQLNTLPGPTVVTRQRSRLSVGGHPLGTLGASPDPGFPLFDPPLGSHASAPPTPPMPAPPLSSVRGALQLHDDDSGRTSSSAHQSRGLCMPFTQRLQTPGLEEEERRAGAGREAEPAAVHDGMEGLDTKTARLRFGKDLRLLEVRRLLSSAEPTTVRIGNAPEVGDPEMQALQQARLLALGMRTMTLPLGRGALTLGTLRPIPTEPLCIPDLCLAGRLPQQHNAVFNLDLSAANAVPGAAADVTAWPEFHNGVAAGIRLAPGGGGLTRSWVVYNKPKTPNYTHAGMLMGLGLAGHLSCLSATDLYRYLSQEHDATTVGVLLGMAASKRGSLDPVISKMLFLHVPARHPVTYPELELSPLVQAAALLGVGLLYQGSCHRLTAEIMMEEIGRRPGGGGGGEFGATSTQGSAVSQDREGYALAAGLALGLITLGKGHSAVSLSDLRIEERLRYYIAGGSLPGAADGPLSSQSNAVSSVFGPGVIGSDPTLGDPSALPPWLAGGLRGANDESSVQSGVSQVVLEGKLVNLDVTSPAATLALGLMFLRTNDAGIAAAFALPDSHFALDYVRPDFVMLRVLAKGLVMQDSVRASRAWVEAQMPPLIKGPVSKFLSRGQTSPRLKGDSGQRADVEALGQAHINAVAGACLSIGIKFAGSANAAAQQVLRHYVFYFLQAKQQEADAPAGAWKGLDKQALEGCLGVVALALGVVMAGTGHLPTLKLLRGLRRRLQGPAPAVVAGQASQHNYSAHMSTSMALGFLFMAGGQATFSTTPQATAALVIALFPRFPHSPTDHRCHLQALRHLYVLATEPRCVDAIDVDSRQSVPVPLTVAHDSAAQQEEEDRRAARAASGDAASVSGALDSEEGLTPEGPCFSRSAPCLLPETQQVGEVSVGGSRYWPQRVFNNRAGDTLDALYRTHTLYVQRKSGALSYLDDPSGVRSLLSSAFHKGNLADQEGFDLVQLCGTFSANPFVMAFAQRFCSSHLPPPPRAAAEGPPTPPQGSTGRRRAAQQAVHEFRAFCRNTLHECITQEKAGSLQTYLLLQSLVDGLLSSQQQSGHTGCQAFKGLTAGLPPTSALWNLKLAMAYYNSSLAHLSASVDAASTSQQPSEEEVWQPLIRPDFLETLWQRLEQLWAQLGFVPAAGTPNPDAALQQYAQSGQYPAGTEQDGITGVTEQFGCFLSLNQLPPAPSMLAALNHANAIRASTGQTSLGGASDDATLSLHLALPSTPYFAVAIMARLL